MEFVRSCAVLLVVFAVSSVSKLRDFRGFLRSLPARAGVEDRWLAPLGVTVAAESAVAVLLAVPATATVGFVLADGLLLASPVPSRWHCGVGGARRAAASAGRPRRSDLGTWSATCCLPVWPPAAR